MLKIVFIFVFLFSSNSKAMQYSEVVVPVNIIKIWKTLQQHLEFEVGGGIDVSKHGEIERIKLATGLSNKISFNADFELAWHTHPSINNIAIYPPSPNDLLVSLVSFTNYWYLSKNHTKDKLIKINSFSSVNNDLALQYMLIISKEGIYSLSIDNEFWMTKWQQSKEKVLQEFTKINYSYHKLLNEIKNSMLNNSLSSQQAIAKIKTQLSQYGINLKLHAWSIVLANGLKLEVNTLI